MARRVVLRVLMTWMAVVAILGTTTAQPNAELALPRLREAIKIPTISTFNGPKDPADFMQFLNFTKSKFPEMHDSLLVDWELVNKYSLLYYVRGSNRSLRPYLLAAHYDVVEASEKNWKHRPFSGYLEEDTELIYGRGTLEDKSRLMAILENVEYKIERGHQPKRSFYLAIGHDQEVNGYKGAQEIAKLLKRRKVSLKFVLDGGTPIVDDPDIPAKKPVAIIGVAEKGYSTVLLRANDSYGHLALPPHKASIVRIAKAIRSIAANPHPIKLDSGLEKHMWKALAPNFSKCFDVILAKKEVFSPTVALFSDRNSTINAFLRTTTTYTITQGEAGGLKINVIPNLSTALLKHSIYSTDTVDSVFEYDKRIVNDDSIHFEKLNQSEPSPISPYDDTAFGYKVVNKTIYQLVKDVIVTPGLNIGTTDSKWYRDLTTQVYRISPYTVTLQDYKPIHYGNERISMQNYQQLVDFYYKLMQNADEAD